MTTITKQKSKGEFKNLIHYYRNLGYEPDLFQENILIINTPIEFIVCFTENTAPLSLFEVHTLLKEASNVSNFTGIKNYILIATGGYEDECILLDGYSVRLEDSNYLESLKNATKKNKPIELLPHNNTAYKNAIKMFETNRLASIVQATGTGKSYIVAKLLQETNYRSVIICPTNDILIQFKELFDKYHINHGNIDFMTYSKLSMISEEELTSKNYDFIVIDEFHRAGASKWGLGVRNLIVSNKSAKVLGTSATPIRYLDDGRNMIDELFEGNVANSIDLFEAIARGILPSPKYIEAIYDISHDIENLTKKVHDNTIISLEDKDEILESIKKFKVSWSNVNTVSSIIKKHFTKNTNKVIVFCKDINHLKEMLPLVKDWFEKTNLYTKVNTYMSYSSNDDRVDELNDFKKANNQNEVNLLFSINKLSEGIHVENVSAVIFLRNTSSNNIFFQQLGRAFSASNDTTPIVLDLINNLEIFENPNFYSNIKNAITDFNNKKEKLGLPSNEELKKNIKFEVIDETKDFLSFIKQTTNNLKYSWDDFLEEALRCKKEKGWFPSVKTKNESKQLIAWVRKQRSLYKRNILSTEKIKKLTDVGFIFSFNKEKWLINYELLLKYKKENNLETFFRHNISDKKINKWVSNQRKRYSSNHLEADEEELLSNLGISFSPLNDIWDYYIDKLKAFYSKNGYRNPTEKEDMELTIFCRQQRRRYALNELSEDKIELLNGINFIWESSDNTIKFEQRLDQLKEYISIYGDTKIPSRFKELNYLGEWAKTMRGKKRKGTLPLDKIQALDKLGFCWDPKNDNANKLLEETIKYTLEKNKGLEPLYCSKKLSDYMTTLRVKYKNNELDEYIINKLNNVNFLWDPNSYIWEKRLNQLKEYYEKYNTFKLSKITNFPELSSLITWLNRQKSLYNKGGYSEEKIKQLQNIGFDFNKNYKKPKL